MITQRHSVGKSMENILVNWDKICRNLSKRTQVSAVLIAADMYLSKYRMLKISWQPIRMWQFLLVTSTTE